MLALDLAFIFGFDHEYFHHRFDSGLSSHGANSCSNRLLAKLILAFMMNYMIPFSSHRGAGMVVIDRKTLANAHIAMDPTRLGGLKDAFIEDMVYFPNPEIVPGPYAAWQFVISDHGSSIV